MFRRRSHGRVLAAKHLDLTEVPTIRLDHLTEAQRRAFMIADNRLTEVAVWDDRLLAEQLKELASVDLDFDIEAPVYRLGRLGVIPSKINRLPLALPIRHGFENAYTGLTCQCPYSRPVFFSDHGILIAIAAFNAASARGTNIQHMC